MVTLDADVGRFAMIVIDLLNQRAKGYISNLSQIEYELLLALSAFVKQEGGISTLRDKSLEGLEEKLKQATRKQTTFEEALNGKSGEDEE